MCWRLIVNYKLLYERLCVRNSIIDIIRGIPGNNAISETAAIRLYIVLAVVGRRTTAADVWGVTINPETGERHRWMLFDVCSADITGVAPSRGPPRGHNDTSPIVDSCGRVSLRWLSLWVNRSHGCASTCVNTVRVLGRRLAQRLAPDRGVFCRTSWVAPHAKK